MENQREREENASIWDRLRQQLEQMRLGLEKKSDPEARARKLAKRASLVRNQPGRAEPQSAPLSFLAFTKGQKRYGIPLENILEVQALEQFSPVPGAPAAIRGVVHWRGAILSLLDLSQLFEISESGLSDLHAYVVVEAGGKRLAVAAFQVEDIVTVPRDRLRAPPELPPSIAPEWVLGVHDDNQLILKMDEVCKHLERWNHK